MLNCVKYSFLNARQQNINCGVRWNYDYFCVTVCDHILEISGHNDLDDLYELQADTDNHRIKRWFKENCTEVWDLLPYKKRTKFIENFRECLNIFE